MTENQTTKTEGERIRGLSIRQPWVDGILYGNKRIENRMAWRGSKFLGKFLIHAAKNMTRDEYNQAVLFLAKRQIEWRPREPYSLTLGAFVGRAEVVDHIYANGLDRHGEPHPRANDPHYMGGFALVLADHVEVFNRPIQCSGMLGFFTVDPTVLPDEPFNLKIQSSQENSKK